MQITIEITPHTRHYRCSIVRFLPTAEPSRDGSINIIQRCKRIDKSDNDDTNYAHIHSLIDLASKPLHMNTVYGVTQLFHAAAVIVHFGRRSAN